MTQYEQLTDEQRAQIDKAAKLITSKMLNDLDYGEEVTVSDNVILSHYSEDEVIVLNIADEWIEVYQYLYNPETLDDSEIEIETL